jgi:hypothetical protein
VTADPVPLATRGAALLAALTSPTVTARV